MQNQADTALKPASTIPLIPVAHPSSCASISSPLHVAQTPGSRHNQAEEGRRTPSPHLKSAPTPTPVYDEPWGLQVD